MRRVKVSELSDEALDWAVRRLEQPNRKWDEYALNDSVWGVFSPSTNWALGGPLADREQIAIWPDSAEGGFFASSNSGAGQDHKGPTMLVAAMRCFVASRLGEEVDIPEEFT